MSQAEEPRPSASSQSRQREFAGSSWRAIRTSPPAYGPTWGAWKLLGALCLILAPSYSPALSRGLVYNGWAMPSQSPIHIPVLAAEVLHWLSPQLGMILVDGTLGGGGHTRLLAEKVGNDGYVLALDRDPGALAAAEKNLAGLPVKIAQSNFCDLPEVLDELGVAVVDGVLLDLGLSSDQLADDSRGFSFEASGELDLRFNPDEGEPAWKLLQRLEEREIADLIFKFGEERFSRRIARRIVEARAESPLKSVKEIAALVRRCVPRSSKERIDPATRTFQALRIAVNRE